MQQEFTSNSEEESKRIAQDIAARLKPGDVVTFNGNLGSGKSFLARHIIKSLAGEHITVTSPTFNIVQEYQLSSGTYIYHYDLYRLQQWEEIYELAFEEALSNNICLIEWPQIIEHILPEGRTNICIEITGPEARHIIVTKNPTI